MFKVNRISGDQCKLCNNIYGVTVITNIIRNDTSQSRYFLDSDKANISHIIINVSYSIIHMGVYQLETSSKYRKFKTIYFWISYKAADHIPQSIKAMKKYI